jgi:RNA polymerase sigma-70 factor (ECF subfamily)
MTNLDPRDELVTYLSALRAFAHSLTRTRSTANDMMQDTVLKALVNIDKFNPETNMRACRFTILRINFHSSCRTLNRENADVDNFFSNKISVKLDRDGRLQFMDFKITFDQLHDEQREALILVGVSGFSYEDAGQIDPDTELGQRLREGTDGQCHDGLYRNPQFANMTAAKWFYTLWVYISLVLTLALLTVGGLAIYPTTKEQRCWVHKMANITGAMPKPMHEKAKAGLQDICPLRHASMSCWVIDGGNKKGGRRRLRSVR